MRALVLFVCSLFAAPAFAAVSVHDAWAPPSLVGSTTGIAYLTLESDIDDALLGASSPVAKVVELHGHQQDGDIWRMRKQDAIALEAGTPVTLRPRGLHLMLYQLKRPLKEGERFAITLRFRDAKPLTIEAVISQQKLLDTLR